jgi:hypothetical protein
MPQWSTVLLPIAEPTRCAFLSFNARITSAVSSATICCEYFARARGTSEGG